MIYGRLHCKTQLSRVGTHNKVWTGGGIEARNRLPVFPYGFPTRAKFVKSGQHLNFAGIVRGKEQECEARPNLPVGLALHVSAYLRDVRETKAATILRSTTTTLAAGGSNGGHFASAALPVAASDDARSLTAASRCRSVVSSPRPRRASGSGWWPAPPPLGCGHARSVGCVSKRGRARTEGTLSPRSFQYAASSKMITAPFRYLRRIFFTRSLQYRTVQYPLSQMLPYGGFGAAPPSSQKKHFTSQSQKQRKRGMNARSVLRGHHHIRTAPATKEKRCVSKHVSVWSPFTGSQIRWWPPSLSLLHHTLWEENSKLTSLLVRAHVQK